VTRVAGVDFGTASVRVSIVDSERGRLSSGVGDYPVLRDPQDPDHATQRHADHLIALEKAFARALASSETGGRDVAALAVATTGSTVVALDSDLTPLGDYYLWSDHRAAREAGEISRLARASRLEALRYCGGAYSAEWGFAKLLHWLRHNPSSRLRFATAAEHCDVIAATLCGITDVDEMPRSVCAMGHKWMYNEALGGLPPDSFLGAVDPLLAGVRDRLSGRFMTSDGIAGALSAEWAARLGLKPGIPIAVGALDAHWDAIGAGCRLGDVVNVIGTSTCIMALSERGEPIEGIPGVVKGSIHPNFAGIEAGLSAVGDLFESIARRAGLAVAKLAEDVAEHRAGETGLLRLAWDNGDRSVLANPYLRGMTLGWRLNHTAADEFFAAIEGTAFHTRVIIERLADHGVPIERILNGGGIPQKNERLNQVYASVLDKPVLVPTRDSTSLGSAIFAFLAAATFRTVEEAQQALCGEHRVVEPDPEEVKVYEDLYGAFKDCYRHLSKNGRFGHDGETAAPIL
jgi:L-ribulokinase